MKNATQNSPIVQILDLAAPLLAEMVKRYEVEAIEAGRKFTDRDREYVELALTIDLIAAVGRYLDKNDTLENVDLRRDHGVVAISCNVLRGDAKHYFFTEVISAGGYNVQRFHYRYLVKSTAPKTAEQELLATLKAKVAKMKKEDKLAADIAHQEAYKARSEAEKAALEAKTDADVEAEYLQYWIDKFGGRPSFDRLNEQAQAMYGTPEAYDRHIRREIEKDQRQRLQEISVRRHYIKQANNAIAKLQAKLQELK